MSYLHKCELSSHWFHLVLHANCIAVSPYSQNIADFQRVLLTSNSQSVQIGFHHSRLGMGILVLVYAHYHVKASVWYIA